MSEERCAMQVRVTGLVQGVAFRAWTRREAEAMGLTGWVRNEADGSVAVLLAGEKASVDRMLHALRDGPASARVTGIHVQPAEPPTETGFRILR